MEGCQRHVHIACDFVASHCVFVTLLCHPDFPGHRWGCGSSWKFWLLIPLVYLQVRNLFVKILLRLWSTHDPTTEKAPLLHRELVFLEAFSQTLTVASPHRNKNQQGATVSSLLAQKQVARRLRSCIPPPNFANDISMVFSWSTAQILSFLILPTKWTYTMDRSPIASMVSPHPGCMNIRHCLYPAYENSHVLTQTIGDLSFLLDKIL